MQKPSCIDLINGIMVEMYTFRGLNMFKSYFLVFAMIVCCMQPVNATMKHYAIEKLSKKSDYAYKIKHDSHTFAKIAYEATLHSIDFRYFDTENKTIPLKASARLYSTLISFVITDDHNIVIAHIDYNFKKNYVNIHNEQDILVSDATKNITGYSVSIRNHARDKWVAKMDYQTNAWHFNAYDKSNFKAIHLDERVFQMALVMTQYFLTWDLHYYPYSSS